MDPPHDHAKFRGGTPGESTPSDLPFQFSGPALGARFHMFVGRIAEDEAKRRRVNTRSDELLRAVCVISVERIRG